MSAPYARVSRHSDPANHFPDATKMVLAHTSRVTPTDHFRGVTKLIQHRTAQPNP